jgi:dTMP kinase
VTATPPGRLIALEGIDGSGKTTQARLLARSLGAKLTHEPGATALGNRLRAVLLDSEGPAPVARAEALLMVADRAQHVEEVIAPLLAAGRWVVSDRYSGSTLAYQGGGRGLPVERLDEVVRFGTGGLEADLTVLVDLDPASARARMAASAPDRLERLDREFHDRVRRTYLAIAAADPEHWVVVDGSGPIDEVARRIDAEIGRRLGPAPGGSG